MSCSYGICCWTNITSENEKQIYNLHILNLILKLCVHGEMYSIQQCGMKFVSDLRQVGSFNRVLRFPPPIKLTKCNTFGMIYNSYHRSYNVSTKKYMETKSNGQYARLRYGLLYLFRCLYLSKLEVNKYQR
jgi:hypothetical protein